MAGYNTSSAYDLSVYEEQEKKLKLKPSLEVIKKNSTKRKFMAVFSPKILGSFAIVITLLCLIIYNQVCLNEVSGEINAVRGQITNMKSEQVKISSQLESMISLRVVGERAKTELGMDRLDKFKTQYVYLYEDARVILGEETPKTEDTEEKKLAVHSIFEGLMEYIR